MHVLLVSEFYPPAIKGGGEVNLELVAKSLAREGYLVSVLTSQQKDLPRFEKKDNVHIHRRFTTGNQPGSIFSNIMRGCIFPISVANQVTKLSKKLKPEAIHFIGTSVIAAPWVKRRLKGRRIRIVATVESYPALCPKGDRMLNGNRECDRICSPKSFLSCQRKSPQIGKMNNSWYLKYNPFFLLFVYVFYLKLRRGIGKCRIVAISRYVKNVLRQHKLSSVVVPNIIDVNSFHAAFTEKSTSGEGAEKSKEGSSKEKPRILFLGSLIQAKGVDVLIRAMEGLACHLDIYGEGPLKAKLTKAITKRKLDVVIHDVVPYEEIPKVYSQADIVVFPSIWPEPFGRISIEALALRKLVIGSNIGGIRETLEQAQKLGLAKLFPPRDVMGLRQALQNLINRWQKEKKKDGQKEFVKHPNSLNLQRYSPQVVVSQLGAIYKGASTWTPRSTRKPSSISNIGPGGL